MGTYVGMVQGSQPATLAACIANYIAKHLLSGDSILQVSRPSAFSSDIMHHCMNVHNIRTKSSLKLVIANRFLLGGQITSFKKFEMLCIFMVL